MDHAAGFRIPMRGYERRTSCATTPPAWFRIPMRGYELTEYTATIAHAEVPNPHEGL